MTMLDIMDLKAGDEFDQLTLLKALAMEIIYLRQEIERLKDRPIYIEASSRLTEEDLGY